METDGSVLKAADLNAAYHTRRVGSEITPGYLGLVPSKEGRTFFQIVLRHTLTGALTVYDFGPNMGDYEVAAMSAVLYHPVAAKKKIPFSYTDVDTHLHAIAYGLDRLGKDGFANFQHGGVITALWTLYKGSLKMGLVQQSRSCRTSPDNSEGMTWGSPRGNLDPGKDVMGTSENELAEEVGAFVGGQSVKLPGASFCQDTAWFRHYMTDGPKGPIFKGIDVVSREVPPALLEEIPNQPGCLRFRQGILAPRVADTAGGLPEYIKGSVFVDWEAAVGLDEGFNETASRLLAYLKSTGAMLVTFGTPVTLAPQK